MYNINSLEILIKSDLSAEEIYNRVIEMYPIVTKQKYSNDEDEPFAVFVGGIGEDDLVTVNEWNYPLTMQFDDKSIYIDFINLIRNKIKKDDASFEKVVLSSIRNLSRNYFYQQNDEQSIENAKLAKIYMDEFKTAGSQRDGYAGDPMVSYTNKQEYKTIYKISKFKGTGDMAKCVEINSTACNLLAFSGFDSVLVQGYFINYNGKSEAHTFPLYKNSEGNYNLLDCTLKQQTKNVLSGNTNFENGFEFAYPVVLKYNDGTEKDSSISYKCLPQKIVTREKQF